MGPISLYLLAVADSGERKTTCDAIFSPALRDWEAGQRQEMSSEIAKLEAATAMFGKTGGAGQSRSILRC